MADVEDSAIAIHFAARRNQRVGVGAVFYRGGAGNRRVGCGGVGEGNRGEKEEEEEEECGFHGLGVSSRRLGFSGLLI